jgi:predicted metal-binding protein
MVRKEKAQTPMADIPDEALCGMAAEQPGVKAARIISPADVETAAWVRLKCQFGCDGYGQSLVCPPFTPTPQQMRGVLDAYRRAVLIHFDAEAEVKAVVADLEREIFLRGAWKAFALGAGSCHFCKSCPVDKGRCRHAERARPAMEACGIDVFSTVRRAGLPLRVVRTTRQCPNYYGLILVD